MENVTAVLTTPGTRRRDLVTLAPTELGPLYEARSTGVSRVLDQVRYDATRGRFTTLVLPTLDLPSVSVGRVLQDLAILADLGVKVLSAREPWFSLEPGQAELLTWMAWALDRQKRARIAAATDKARREGRPPGRPRAVIPSTVFEMAARGCSLRQIARVTGLGASTVGRAIQAHRALNIDPQETPNPEVR